MIEKLCPVVPVNTPVWEWHVDVCTYNHCSDTTRGGFDCFSGQKPSGAVSEPPRLPDTSEAPKVSGRVLAAIAFSEALGDHLGRMMAEELDEARTKAISELLTAIEDAGNMGAIDTTRMSGQRLVEKALELRRCYP